ncbi:MAG: c-type cytochrome, partial [Acidobacteriota bacterium]
MLPACAVLLLGPPSLAQVLPAEDVRPTYAKLCSGCHGADARGTQQGPGLAGNPWVRRRSAQSLRNVIRGGVPAAGMPAFDLPANMIDSLAAMIVSLNAVAAESNVPGDQGAGRTYFFGSGKCATCHMVSGEGSAVGPDLSGVARELTVDQIREALLQPAARIAPGYEAVTAKLRSGETVRGFERSRTKYDVVIQDLLGKVHPLSLDAVTMIDAGQRQSLMPALKADGAEVQNLVAFLSGLTGVKLNAAVPARNDASGGIDFARILNPKPGDWLTYNGDLSGNRYSPLTQVNRENVNKLSLQWAFSIPLWRQFLP